MSGLWQFLQKFTEILVWWTLVAPWEGAVRVRFGKHAKVLRPGIHLRIPYFDQVYRQTIRLRISMMPVQTLSTSDGKTVTLSATIGYRIVDIGKLYNTLHHAEETIRNMAAANIARFVQTHALKDCAALAIEEWATSATDLSKFGLANEGVKIIDFAAVRTYRLISDQKWGVGDHLDMVKWDGQIQTR